MNNPLNKMRHNSAAVFSAWLIIGYILARVGIEVYNLIRLLLLPAGSPVGMRIHYMVDYTVVIYMLPFVLFAVYLLFLYRRNRHNVLMPIAFTLAALLKLPALIVSVNNLRWVFASDHPIMVHITDVGTRRVYSVYYLVSFAVALTIFVAYALFAVDGFCKFRLRGVSRVLTVVSFGAVIIRRFVQWLLTSALLEWTWRFSPHSLVDMVLDLLLYGSLIVFFFGAAEKDDRIRLTPCHATVSRQLSDSYVAPVVPTPARFCGHCGSPVQGDLCPNCGAQD